jgi:hypothetical protein
LIDWCLTCSEQFFSYIQGEKLKIFFVFAFCFGHRISVLRFIASGYFFGISKPFDMLHASTVILSVPDLHIGLAG